MKYAFVILLGTLGSYSAHAKCGANTLEWGEGCASQVFGQSNEGASVSVSDTTANRAGAAVFKCEKGQWVYVSGDCASTAKDTTSEATSESNQD